MAKQRMVSTSFWTDWYVQDHLDPIEKLLFLYLITNDRTEICGVYEITVRKISFETGIEKDMVEKILTRFEDAGKLKRKECRIYIINFSKYQQKNPSVLQGIERSLEPVPLHIKDFFFWESQKWQQEADIQSVDSVWQGVALKLNLNSNLTWTEPNLSGDTKPEYWDPTVNNVIHQIKTRCKAYWIVYDPVQERSFATHILSKKRLSIGNEYGFATWLEFALHILDASMQEGNWWRFKIKWPRDIYQKYPSVYSSLREAQSTQSDSQITSF